MLFCPSCKGSVFVKSLVTIENSRVTVIHCTCGCVIGTTDVDRIVELTNAINNLVVSLPRRWR